MTLPPHFFGLPFIPLSAWLSGSYFPMILCPSHPAIELKERVWKPRWWLHFRVLATPARTLLFLGNPFLFYFTFYSTLHFQWKQWNPTPHFPFSLQVTFCFSQNVCITEKAMAPHSSTLAWKIPWTEEPWMGSLRVRHDWATLLSLVTFMHWRRKWQPTPVFFLENPRDGGAWWAAVYGVAQSWTLLKRLSSSRSMYYGILQPHSLPPQNVSCLPSFSSPPFLGCISTGFLSIPKSTLYLERVSSFLFTF